MNPLLRSLRDQTLAANEKAVEFANNAFDRIFVPGTMVRSEQTESEVIHTYGITSVRYYPPLDGTEIRLDNGDRLPVQRKRYTMPLVMVPPLAARPAIFDLTPTRSLVRYFNAAGFSVYLIDWGEPSREQAELGLGDYVNDLLPEALKQIRGHAGEMDLSLLAWCLGGLFSLMYAGASHDPHLKNIVTIASPIDTRQGKIMGQLSAALMQPAEFVRRFTGFRIHRLTPSRTTVPGWANALAFKLTNPLGSITTYWDLILRMWDREFVESHTTTSNVLNNMLAYPGRLIQDMLVKFAIDNDLSSGQIELDGKLSEFGRIQSSLLAFAGQTDTLVVPEAARRSLELIASDDKQFIIAPGGHMGVLAGATAQQSVWAPAAEWLSRRSGAFEVPARAERERLKRQRRRLADDPSL
ncbi:MAG: alpha/beta fold hydrolase [Panacagrimonas sp.]